jgi:hypothetical protein
MSNIQAQRSEQAMDDGIKPVVVAGRQMLFEVAIRGMDGDLFELARHASHTPQGVCDTYANLHFLRYDEEWQGFAIW